MFFQPFLDPDFGLFLLRLGLGIVFIYHGWPKIIRPGNLTEGMGMRSTLVWLIGVVELIGGLALIIGLWSQLFSLLLAIIMVGAIYKKNSVWRVPFSSTGTTGWEFDLILLAANLCIFFTGGGYMPGWF